MFDNAQSGRSWGGSQGRASGFSSRNRSQNTENTNSNEITFGGRRPEKRTDFRGGRSFGGNSSSRGGNDFRGGRSGFGGNRGGGGFRGGRGGGRKRFQSEEINQSKYIYTPEPIIEAEVEEKQLFSTLNLEKHLQDNLDHMKYEFCTKIQAQSIPLILQGRDVIGISSTGSGKTAAFLLPMIHKYLTGDLSMNSQILILTPTRELAAQIREVAFKFTAGLPKKIFSTVLIGGANIYQQIEKLNRKPQIIIATPGRLKDLIDRRAVSLNNMNTLILDEMDKMLDMGFVDDIREIVNLMPSERQSLFFSATIVPKIRSLIDSYATNPATVEIGSISAAKTVHQDIVKVAPGESKTDKLIDLINGFESKKIIIFTETKRDADNLFNIFRDLRMRYVDVIHGDKTQFMRSKALQTFKSKDDGILIATDVMARGIDVQDVGYVVNFDEPHTLDDYMHRIGRTGRAGKSGHAYTFVN
jgi:ATP-dependent RNA helicase RhlE